VTLVLGGLAEWALVGRHLEPLEGGLDAANPLLTVALDVGVLDAQHEDTTVPTGEEPVEQRGARTPDVEEPGGRGAKRTRGAVKPLDA